MTFCLIGASGSAVKLFHDLTQMSKACKKFEFPGTFGLKIFIRTPLKDYYNSAEIVRRSKFVRAESKRDKKIQ